MPKARYQIMISDKGEKRRYTTENGLALGVMSKHPIDVIIDNLDEDEMIHLEAFLYTHGTWVSDIIELGGEG